MAGFIDTLFGGGAEREAADKNRAIMAGYGTDANAALKTGYDTGTADLTKGIAAYDPLATLATQYNKAGALNLDALGVNGAEGNARATGAFQTTPGYALTQKAALEGIDRRRAIGGMYSSGNADIDTGNWITKNLYETQYAPWMAGLQRAGEVGGQYTGTVAGGQSAGYGKLSDLAGQYGSNVAGVSGNVASGNVSANNLQAQGEASGAKNLLGAGLSLATAAMGMPSGSITGMFGSGGGGTNFSNARGPMDPNGAFGA